MESLENSTSAENESLENSIKKYHPNMPMATAFGLNSFFNSGYNIEVDTYSYGVPALHWANGEKKKYRLKIGRFCSIAAQVSIYVGSQGIHPYDFISTYPLHMAFNLPYRGDKSSTLTGDLGVEIGSDVWIGRGVIIQSGVKIGHGAVIGTSAIVTNDVAPYSIVAGIPAKLVRLRFSPEQIQRLLDIKWWTWDSEIIKKNLPLFYMSDIEASLKGLERIATNQ